MYACRFAGPDVLWVLTGQRFQRPGGQVFRLERAAGSADAGGPGNWTKPAPRILSQSAKGKKDATGGDGSVRQAASWTDLAVNLELGGVQRGSKGAVYLGTAGHPTNTDVDTLYWFDGESTWHATGLRATVPAPVTAVVCDPANPDRVYVGTTVGVWRGLRILSDGEPPKWPTWDALVNGLPEAAVEDLTLFDSGGVRLLRAAIAARGIWELQLDPPLTELSYVRAHDDDQRRRPRALETKRDGSSPPLLARQPGCAATADAGRDPEADHAAVDDDRPARRPRGPPPLPGGAPLADERPALPRHRTLGPLLRGGAPRARRDADRRQQRLHHRREPLGHGDGRPGRDRGAVGGGRPERGRPLRAVAELHEGEPGAASCSLPPAQLKVDVVVHRRSLAPIDGNDVRVTLLQWIDPRASHRAKYDDPTTWFSGDVPWTTAVNDVLNSSGGTTSATFGAGWAFVGSGAKRRKTLAGQTLDPLRSGVVTFDIDLRHARSDLLLLLVAVIRQGASLALAPASLQDLALTSPNVAVRSVRVNPSASP